MRTRHLIFAIGLIFFSSISTAQFSVNGNVKSKSNSTGSLQAVVYIHNLKTGVTTDSAGNFSFRDIRPGDYLFEVSCSGFISLVEQIPIDKDTTLTFLLEDQHKELSEVVVTSVTRSSELKMVPFSVSTLDQNSLAQSSAQNIIDRLKNVPGVNQITTGPAISKPVIRGLGYNRVITLHNGIRQEGQQWGDEHGIEIDQYSIDRVEIVKGPASLMYGSDGIAGVVNFLGPKPLPSGTARTELLAEYQTNNNLAAYSISHAGSSNGIQWLGRFSNRYAGNYHNHSDGYVYNSGFEEINGNATLGINRNWGHSYLNFSTYNSRINLPEGDRNSLGNFIYTDVSGDVQVAPEDDQQGYDIGMPFQRINHLKVVSNNLLLLNKGNMNLDLSFQNNRRREFADPGFPGIAELYFDLNTINFNLRYNFPVSRGFSTSIGASGMLQNNQNRGTEVLIPEYDQTDFGLFVYTQKKIGKQTSAAGGISIDSRFLDSKMLWLDSLDNPVVVGTPGSEEKFNAIMNEFYGLSGSFGITHQLNNQTTLKFNFARGYRAPTMAELSSNGRHEGTFRYEYGNPNLEPEFSHQADIGYLLNSKHVVVEISPFVNYITNYIFTEKLVTSQGTDSIPDPDDPAPAFQYTSGNALLYGGEIYTDVHPHPLDWLHIANSFSFVSATQSEQPDSTRYLPFIPAPRYRGELKATFENEKIKITGMYGSFSVDYYFAQDQVFSAWNTETPTPSYTLLQLAAGITLKAFGRNDAIDLRFNIDNLADIDYQDHLSKLKYAPLNPATGQMGINNMGRNFRIRLMLTI